jgi:hypothetical protein
MLTEWQLAGPVRADGRGERVLPVKQPWQETPWCIVVGGSRSTPSPLNLEPWGCVYLSIGPLTLYISEAKARDFTWETRDAGKSWAEWTWTDYKRSGNYPMLRVKDKALAEALQEEIRRAGRIALGLEPMPPRGVPSWAATPDARLSGKEYAQLKAWRYACPVCGRKRRSQLAVAQHLRNNHPPGAA